MAINAINRMQNYITALEKDNREMKKVIKILVAENKKLKTLTTNEKNLPKELKKSK